MTRDPRRLRDDLGHILRGFLQSEMVQDAVIRNFEVIGEASRNIEHSQPDFVVALPSCRWRSPTSHE